MMTVKHLDMMTTEVQEAMTSVVGALEDMISAVLPAASMIATEMTDEDDIKLQERTTIC
jgi:hypothetical protein